MRENCVLQELIKKLESSQLFNSQEPLYDELIVNYRNKTKKFSKKSIEQLQALCLHSETIQGFIDHATELTKSQLPQLAKQKLIGALIETITLLEFNLLCLYLNIQTKIFLNFPDKREEIAAAFLDCITDSIRVTAAEVRKQNRGGSL